VRFRLATAAVATAALVAGCTSSTSGQADRLGSPRSESSATGSARACPASYVPPDPRRPKVWLRFDVGADLTSVQGSERVEFTPDRPITELVFRLTANTAPTVREGNKIVITSARADHGGGAPTYDADGAAPTTQGGLLRIPFAARIPAGTTVRAQIAFTVTLGDGAFDRFGRAGDGPSRYAWFASAQPLLAWERGYGWHTEPMLQFTAESATSEAMRTDLTVTAPASETVIMSGDPADPPTDGPIRTWHSTIESARDVSVAVGPFTVSDKSVNGVKLRVGATSAQERDQLVPLFEQSIIAHSRRFGPFPFPSLSVARVPAEGGGIEYPSSILMMDDSRVVAVHETAHQWFYAMVGDSQAMHAWLDEAFATYAEQLVDGDAPALSTLTVPGHVDKPTASYGDAEHLYYAVTYGKGAAALHAARTAAGGDKFDAAIRCYVNANAWRIANPSDLEAALSAFPAALGILRKAHALP
jgi:Peptidase family M1 domain